MAQRLFAQAGSATETLQQQIDSIMQVLRGDIPQPSSYAVTDPTGKLLAWIGYNVVNNVVYQGGWFKQFYVGGTDAAHAVISSDINGNVTIDGATIKLISGPNSIVLDPTVPDIVITDAAGDVITLAPTKLTAFAFATKFQTRIQNGIITVEDLTNPSHQPATQVSPDQIAMVGPTGLGVISAQTVGNDGVIDVFGNSGTHHITLDGGTGNITTADGNIVTATGGISATAGNIAAGLLVTAGVSMLSGGPIVATTYVSAGDYVNATTGFQYNTTPGINTNFLAPTSLTVNTVANGLRGTPGAGQSNTTVVTGVTLNTAAHQVLGGIITV